MNRSYFITRHADSETLVFLTLVFFFLLLPSFGWAATWYVRPTTGGYRILDGKTYATAFDGWAGIKWGINGVSPGDTLYVCGTFYGENANIEESGRDDANRITIRFDCPGDPGTLDGMNKDSHALRCSGKNFITLIKPRLKNGKYDNLGIVEACNNLIVDGLVTDSGHMGVYHRGNNATYRNFVVSNMTASGMIITECDNCTIEKGIVANNGNSGLYNHDGLFVGNGSLNAAVKNVKAYNNKSSLGTGIDVSGDNVNPMSVTVSECESYSNEGSGFAASGLSDEHYKLQYSKAYNNHQNLLLYEDISADIYHNEFGNAIYASIVSTAANKVDKRVVRMGGNIIKGVYPRAVIVYTSHTTLTSDFNNLWGGTSALVRKEGVDMDDSKWKSTGFDVHSFIRNK